MQVHGSTLLQQLTVYSSLRNYSHNTFLAINLLSAIAILPEARETDTPTFKNNRRVLRLLGAFYRHVLEAFTNIKLSLHEQLVHISAAMHLMMAIYQKEAGRFVPSQTYFGLMTAGKNLFFCVAKTQLDDPDGRFWIIQPGSDPLEGSFGTVRTISCSETNTDMAQLGNRLTAAVDSTIFSQNILSGLVKNASTKTTWMAGRRTAEHELQTASWEPPFAAMEAMGGFTIFCPFGKNKMSPPEETTVPATSDTPPQLDSDAQFHPDVEDVALEALISLEPATKAPEAYLLIPGSTKTQHKATVLRIFSSRFSISERLKRVRGFSRRVV
ncbi:hypothetical protein DFH07DRAFT_770652 [Mycena maculata]|uniref:Uncharacterized protein n=1 Tax=Mycena maculata TaxID=230809 RepID=A0AAD7JI93_9AGAR|nr:hypothetical protein DFH07DRAFT_770652 [Mycena maculata]